MSRYRDRTSLGRSNVVPFCAKETYAERHARRLTIALAEVIPFETWCESFGLQLRITNRGHHWRIIRPNERGVLVQWWPSTAKTVVRERWENGIHAHDIDQLKKIIVKEMHVR